MTKETQELKTVQTELANPKNEMEMLQILINSKTLPANIKTIEQAFTIAQFGKELGLKPMQAFHQIYNVSGKLALSARALAALLWNNKISYRTIKDFETVKRLNSKGEEYNDIETTIEFKRDNVIEVSSFFWNDAKIAGWTTKDNWQKLPRHMMWARCLALGANRIAPDKTLGLYTVEEIIDITDSKNVKITEEGEVQIIN